MKLIGADTSEILSLGFTDARETGFSLEDLYQDVDATNMASYLKTNTIFQVFTSYYDTDVSSKRFTQFTEDRIGDLSTLTNIEIRGLLYDLAYDYASKQAIIHTYLLIASDVIQNFDALQWGVKTATAFADKIMQLMVGEE